MDFTSLLPDSVLGWLNVLGLAVGCSSVVAAALAPLTKNTKDDALARKLKWLHDKVALLGFHPSHAVKTAGQAVTKLGGSVVVVDHRTKK